MLHTPVRTDLGEALIHAGRVFTSILGSDLDSGESATIALTTPSNREVHLRILSQFAFETRAQYFKDATITGGATITPFNKNFNSTVTTEVVLKGNPTISVVGTTLFDVTYGASQKSSGILGFDGYILAKDTTYYMTLTSAAANNKITTQLIWAECDC